MISMIVAYSFIDELKKLPGSAYRFTLTTRPVSFIPGMASIWTLAAIPSRINVILDSLTLHFTCINEGSGRRMISCLSRTVEPASTTNSALPPLLL